MEPAYPYGMSTGKEGMKKTDRDFQIIDKNNIPNTADAEVRVPGFHEGQVRDKPKQTRKNKIGKLMDNLLEENFPKRGTFDPPSFQDLMSKSTEVFQKRHHILARLS